jgi:hypothetical protein
MKKYLVGAAAGILGLLLSPVLPASAIIGGAPDDREHPHVGQLFFYVPSAVDSRFDHPGSWYNCSGTLIDPNTVVTAGHCTYAVGDGGVETKNPLYGGTDIWFSTSEKPDYSVFPASTTFGSTGNEARYAKWSSILDASKEWSEASSTFTHPEYVDAGFLFHDLGVVELSAPIVIDDGNSATYDYGTLPTANYLDTFYSKGAKQRARFEAVGYGLEGSGPKYSFGGDTRRKIDQRLISFKGVFGLRNISVNFGHGTCSGDSGGPTFDISSPALTDKNLIVAVTSFGFTSTCTAGGSYRIDQPDDLAFLDNPSPADYR